MQFFIYLLAEHPFAFLLIIRYSEATFDHVLQVVLFEERQVGLLNANHFIIGEPIRCLLLIDFIEQLCVKLLVVDGFSVINQLALRNLEADVSSTSCGVAKRMLIVGSCQERGISASIILTSAKDGSPIHFYFRKRLLELALLTGAHIGKLVDIHQQVMRQRHIRIKLVAEVDVV